MKLPHASQYSPVLILFMSLSLCVPAARAKTSADNQPAAQSAPFILAKFEKSFTTRKAKVGDLVTAKTVRDLHLKDLDIPKGSRLVGTVAAVQSRKDGDGNSSLSIKFDKVEFKDGKTLPVEGLIVSIAELSSDTGLGPTSVLSRGGVGTTNGLDPNMEVDKGVSEQGLHPGSSIPGVALSTNLDANGDTELRGIKTEIKFDSDTEIKVALFRSK